MSLQALTGANTLVLLSIFNPLVPWKILCSYRRRKQKPTLWQRWGPWFTEPKTSTKPTVSFSSTRKKHALAIKGEGDFNHNIFFTTIKRKKYFIILRNISVKSEDTQWDNYEQEELSDGLSDTQPTPHTESHQSGRRQSSQSVWESSRNFHSCFTPNQCGTNALFRSLDFRSVIQDKF